MIGHNILLFKLNHCSIWNRALNILKATLREVNNIETFGSTDSAMLNIHKGVTQSSFLGPLLFILYINDFMYSTDKFDFLIVLYYIICLFRKHSPYKSLQNIDII